MKNVLFATSALVATSLAGTAYADAHLGVSLSGAAEMGIKFKDVSTATAAPDDGQLRFHHDLDVKFTLTGETDNGLEFGATVDLDEIDGFNGTDSGMDTSDPDLDADSGEHSVYISGSFGTVSLGDVDGAFDKALSEIAAGSAIDDAPETGGWNGNSGLDGTFDGQILRYDYSFSDFTFSVSAELDDGDGTGATDGDPVFGVGVAFDGEVGGFDLGFGLGYQATDNIGDAAGTDANIMGASVTGAFSGVTVILNYSVAEAGTAEATHTGISLEYTTGDLTFGANYGQFDRNAAAGADSEGFGLWATYDLGGGLKFVAGYGSEEIDGGTDTTVGSMGFAMSF
jgi:outer membrane protein OmpU